MTTNRILTQPQAKAIYSAMCALNNVSLRFVAEWEQVHDTGYYPKRKEQFEVREQRDGSILVRILGCDGVGYPNQAAFAAAYGLNGDEPQSDVAAAAGGLTQTAIER